MKYEPEKHELIDYLYGNVRDEEKKKIESYLQQHPEVKKELEEMKNVRGVLGKFDDREVLVPGLLLNNPSQATSAKSLMTPFMIRLVSIAAAIVLVLLIGYFTGFQMRYEQKQLTISFRNAPTTPVTDQQSITQEEMQALINEALSKNKQPVLSVDSIKGEIKSWLVGMEEVRHKAFSNKVDEMMVEQKQQLNNYALQLETKSAETLDEYFQNTSINQRAYMEGVLVDFTKYMDEQRLQDRQFYLNNLVDLKYAADVQQQETEQILTSIMNRVNSLPEENETQNF